MPFIDIGCNLTDSMYQGKYNNSQKHPPDLDHVLARAWEVGLSHIVITAGTLDEARKALELASDDRRLFTTVGVHPTRCKELVEAEEGMAAYIDTLLDLAREGQKNGKVVAIGECGLDYDRLGFCDQATQLAGFEAQFALAEETGLPMFLHNRNCANDFVQTLQRHRHRFSQGVVHSFTGPPAEVKALLSMERVYIGLNGCSLKTEDQLTTIQTHLPLGRTLLETDAPWCDVRPTHASARYLQSREEKGMFGTVKKEKWSKDKCVKGRNEPCHIREVAAVLAGVHGVPLEQVIEVCYANTLTCFPGLVRLEDAKEEEGQREGTQNQVDIESK